jgi:hypothetical protein
METEVQGMGVLVVEVQDKKASTEGKDHERMAVHGD